MVGLIEVAIFLTGQLHCLGGSDLQRLFQPVNDIDIFKLLISADGIQGFLQNIRPSAGRIGNRPGADKNTQDHKVS